MAGEGERLGRELEVARQAAERAAAAALAARAKGLQVENKPDASPVSNADKESERLIAAMIDEAFPEDGLLGEEGVRKPSRSGRQWIVDPIDGTRDFVRGSPLWAVLIGLEAEGEVVAGVAHLPALGEMYFAAPGSGAYRNESRIRVSTISERREAVLCVNGLDGMAGDRLGKNLVEWMAGFWAVRSLGGCPDSMLVASGRAEAWLERRAQPWDLAAPKIIVEEAGGKFFNFDGGSSIYGGNCVVCTPGLEAEMRRFVAAG